jgi:hypothetical protein
VDAPIAVAALQRGDLADPLAQLRTAALSSSASASKRLSLLFSASISLSRRASETVIPAYFVFQL